MLTIHKVSLQLFILAESSQLLIAYFIDWLHWRLTAPIKICFTTLVTNSRVKRLQIASLRNVKGVFTALRNVEHPYEQCTMTSNNAEENNIIDTPRKKRETLWITNLVARLFTTRIPQGTTWIPQGIFVFLPQGYPRDTKTFYRNYEVSQRYPMTLQGTTRTSWSTLPCLYKVPQGI
jgi:hypothetical protein